MIIRTIKYEVTMTAKDKKLVEKTCVEMTERLNSIASYLFAVHAGALPEPTGPGTSPPNRIYRMLRGSWNPPGLKGDTSHLAPALVDAVKRAVQPRISASEFKEVARGERRVVTFRKIPLCWEKSDVVVKDDTITAPITPETRVTFKTFDKVKGYRRRLVNKILRGQDGHELRSVRLTPLRDNRWTACLGYALAPSTQGGAEREITCGVDLGVTTFAMLGFVFSDTGEIATPPIQIRVPRDVERKLYRYGQLRRDGLDTDKYYRARKDAYRKLCWRIVNTARSVGATRIVFEDLSGFRKDDVERTEHLTGRRRAAMRRASLKFLPGELIGTKKAPGLLPQVAEREGLEFLMVSPYYTSRVCCRCGQLYSKYDKAANLGRRPYTDFFRCGNHGIHGFMNADKNAAVNIARAGSSYGQYHIALGWSLYKLAKRA